MPGEGVMAAANASLKYNRSQLHKRRLYDHKDLFFGKPVNTKLKFKKVLPEELSLIKDSIRKRAQRDRRRVLVLSVFISTLTLLLFWHIFMT